MKTFFFSLGKLFVVWMMVGLVACDKKDKPPNPNPGGTGEIRNVGNFAKLVNKSMAIVYVTQGDYKPLKIEADSAIVPLIQTFVKNDTLFIQFKKDTIIKATKAIKIFITVPKLFYARLDGVGGFVGQNKFNYNDAVVYEVRGAGGYNAEMNTTKFVGIIKGAGEMEIAGSATNKEITISGAGKFEGRNLISQNAIVKVSGVGNAYINAQKKLDVTITGVGSIYYKGEPQITKIITGIGILVKLP